RETRLCGHVLEGAIAPVAVEMIRGLRARLKAVERRAVDEKQIDESIAVVIDHRDAGPRRFQQVHIPVASAEDRGHVQAAVARDVRDGESRAGWPAGRSVAEG